MTVAERSEARNFFSHLNIGIVGSNSIRGTDVCLSLCCPVQVSVLCRADLPSKEYYCLKDPYHQINSELI
jgi:hypothetical protein